MRKRPHSSSSSTPQSPAGAPRGRVGRGSAAGRPARPAPPKSGPRTEGRATSRAEGKPAPYAAARPEAVERPSARPRPPVPREAEPRSADMDSSGGAPWLWGHHAVAAALQNPARKFVRLVATEEAAGELAGMLGGPSPVEPQIMKRESIAKLLPPGAVHQGVALLAKTLKPWQLEDVIAHLGEAERAIVVVLDQVTDPHNIGAILRSAAAFGAICVVLPDRNAPEISGTLAKSASGAVEHVPLVRVVNLNRTLELLKKAGFWSVGLAGEAEQTLASHKLGGRVALVLGSEGDGLRRLTREACDLMARLPTQGPVASLNVSNAAAIALYELVRAG